MTGRAPTFKKADIKRAVAAVQATGLPVCEVVIDPSTGKITITTNDQGDEQVSPFDKWKASRERST
jgi:hypothetical protein